VRDLRTEYTRERLQVRARALSRNFKVEVAWSGSAYTDGKRIYLPGRGTQLDALSEVELLVALHALDIHEAAHLRYSSWEVLDTVAKLPPEERGLTKHVLNILEDARVELLIANSHPGTADYLRFFNELALERWLPSLETVASPEEQFLHALAQRAIVGRLKGKPAEEVRELLEEVEPLVQEARFSRDPWKPFEAARRIVEKIKERWGIVAPPPLLSFRFNSLESCRNSAEQARENASLDTAGRSLEEVHKSRGSADKRESRRAGDAEPVPRELAERIKAELKRAEMERASKEAEVKLEGDVIKEKLVVKLIEGGFREEYAAICAEVAPLKRLLFSKLRELLVAKSRVNRGLKKGKLDPTRIHRIALGREDVYYRRNRHSHESVGFLLLVDESGSMCLNRRYIHARKAAVLFSEVLRELKIRHMVVGFSADEGEKGTVNLRVYRTFSEKHSRASTSMASIRARKENRDGAAIRAATEYLARQRFAKRVMLVISDGLPHAFEYYPPESVKDTAKAVKEARRKGIRVIGISIDPDAGNYLPKIYPARVIVKRLEELPAKLLKVARRELAT
jgi:hypothetical protein